jgi:hypothetical protein
LQKIIFALRNPIHHALLLIMHMYTHEMQQE